MSTGNASPGVSYRKIPLNSLLTRPHDEGGSLPFSDAARQYTKHLCDKNPKKHSRYGGQSGFSIPVLHLHIRLLTLCTATAHTIASKLASVQLCLFHCGSEIGYIAVVCFVQQVILLIYTTILQLYFPEAIVIAGTMLLKNAFQMSFFFQTFSIKLFSVGVEAQLSMTGLTTAVECG